MGSDILTMGSAVQATQAVNLQQKSPSNNKVGYLSYLSFNNKNNNGNGVPGSSGRNPQHLALHSSLNVPVQSAEGHYLEQYIRKPKLLNSGELEALLDPANDYLDLAPNMLASGALCASNGNSHKSAWVRDMALVALCHYSSAKHNEVRKARADENGDSEKAGKLVTLIEKDYDIAVKIAECIYRAYARGPQRDILTEYSNIAWNPNWTNDKLDADHSQNFLHTKFAVNESGELVNYRYPWGMQQIDALGYALTLFGKLAQEGRLDFTTLDCESNALGLESTLVALVRFMRHIRCWEIKDLGPWEKTPDRHTSSIAAVLNSLVAIKDYFQFSKYKEKSNDNEEGTVKASSRLNVGYTVKTSRVKQASAEDEKKFPYKQSAEYNMGRFLNDLEITITNCQEALAERITPDGAIEGDNQPLDMGLSLVLGIADIERIGLSKRQQQVIITETDKLRRDRGYIRYAKNSEDKGKVDDYMGANWPLNPKNSTYNKHGEFADRKASNFEEAQWTMFDAYAMIIYLKKVIKSNYTDLESYERSQLHLRRLLAHMPSHDYEYIRPNTEDKERGIPPVTVRIPKGKMLEATWLIHDPHQINLTSDGVPVEASSDGKPVVVPGENGDFEWTKAVAQEALTMMIKVAEELERRGFSPDTYSL